MNYRGGEHVQLLSSQVTTGNWRNSGIQRFWEAAVKKTVPGLNRDIKSRRREVVTSRERRHCEAPRVVHEWCTGGGSTEK